MRRGRGCEHVHSPGARVPGQRVQGREDGRVDVSETMACKQVVVEGPRQQLIIDLGLEELDARRDPPRHRAECVDGVGEGKV